MDREKSVVDSIIDESIRAAYNTGEELVLDSLRQKNVSFKWLEDIRNILFYLAVNKLNPTSLEGKHVNVDLQNAIDEFNNVFKEHGLNPNLKIDWNLC